MNQDEIVKSISEELGESDAKAISQISEIVEEIGEEKSRMIVLAAKILFDVGGLVRMSEYVRTIYGNLGRRRHHHPERGPRTLGGTFFFLFSLTPQGISLRVRNPQQAPKSETDPS